MPLFYASLAEGFLIRKGARQQQLHHHLRCWAINGWSGDDDKDEWCTNNCIHIPSYCPQDTGDGGGCDCNCDEGDEGCPRNLTKGNIFNILKLKIIFLVSIAKPLAQKSLQKLKVKKAPVAGGRTKPLKQLFENIFS